MFAHLINSRCCHLQSILLVKLCNLRDNGATVDSLVKFIYSFYLFFINAFTWCSMSDHSTNILLFSVYFLFQELPNVTEEYTPISTRIFLMNALAMNERISNSSVAVLLAYWIFLAFSVERILGNHSALLKPNIHLSFVYLTGQVLRHRTQHFPFHWTTRLFFFMIWITIRHT